MPAPRHALVTGAGSGIGRAIALELARRGGSLTLMGRRSEPLAETAGRCREAGARVALVRTADVGDAVALDEAVASACGEIGPLHDVVANAGIGGPNAPGQDDRFGRIVRTNLDGCYHSFRAAQARLAPAASAPRMLAVSSVLARFGVPGYTGYCASKTAVLGLVRALAMELAGSGTAVNALCPGWVDTQMARDGIADFAERSGQSFEQAHTAAMAQVPVGRMSTPAEIARVAAWLLHDAPATLTGQAIDVNGGAWMS